MSFPNLRQRPLTGAPATKASLWSPDPIHVGHPVESPWLSTHIDPSQLQTYWPTLFQPSKPSCWYSAANVGMSLPLQETTSLRVYLGFIPFLIPCLSQQHPVSSFALPTHQPTSHHPMAGDFWREGVLLQRLPQLTSSDPLAR